MNSEQIIVKMKFGSHLYGTNTPSSDIDYKGVFLPTKEQVLLGKIPRVINKSTNKTNIKNTPDDIDEEYYSLHYFVNQACSGETIALDMLHATPSHLEITHPLWDLLVSNRSYFYTKNLKAFVGYARKQAAKYGIKGSRLNAAKEVIDVLTQYSLVHNRLSDFWSLLPTNEHCKVIEPSPNNIRQYSVCGRIIQETVTIDYALSIVKRFYDNYGHRAEQAANNEGIDWKAVSHAIRAAYQVKELLTNNTITFPRPEAKYLSDVKQGKLDFLADVNPLLESLIEEVEFLSNSSSLPEKVNRKFFDGIIIYAMKEFVL